MQNTEGSLPKNHMEKWATVAQALGRRGVRMRTGAGRAWRETAAGLASVRTWVAALVMLTGVLLMLAGLAAGIWLREKPLLTIGICLSSILTGVMLVGFSRVVAAAELYIHHHQ